MSERDAYDRERIAFRLRNPEPQYAEVTARCRAAWLAARWYAPIKGGLGPRAIAKHSVPTCAVGPWYLENQAWLTRCAQMRVISPQAHQATPDPKGAA